jgi:putative Mg2+ transporter-C (MgtC) family protein
MSQFFAQNGEIILRLVVATGLGLLVGAERLFVKEAAGMKTHALVSMGAAVFTIVSELMVQKYASLPGLNPTIIPSTIVVGIGFLGAGSIILQGSRLVGVTTAGGLWVMAGIGMAAGAGFLSLAAIATVLMLLVLLFVNLLEKPIRKISNGIGEQPKV